MVAFFVYYKKMKKVFQGEIFSVWQWEQKLYDGSTAIFEKIERPDYAFMVGTLPDKRILLVWDEQPHREGALTPAGGKVEAGESPEEAAEREFQEETGYKATIIIPWFSGKPQGKVDFTSYAFIGRNIQKTGDPTPEAGEKISLRFFTFDEFLALGQDESLRELRLRIMLLEAQLDQKKKEDLYEKLYG